MIDKRLWEFPVPSTNIAESGVVLCSDMIEIKGYVIISDFLNVIDTNVIETVNKLEDSFKGKKEYIEKFIND
ncbi:MAG TPA: hypothetical protein GXX75_04000 [Clostridiales bacterium]|nr:hypothetical protein [Clostridiales bacterium]